MEGVGDGKVGESFVLFIFIESKLSYPKFTL